jgi:hypothetical protein
MRKIKQDVFRKRLIVVGYFLLCSLSNAQETITLRIKALNDARSHSITLLKKDMGVVDVRSSEEAKIESLKKARSFIGKLLTNDYRFNLYLTEFINQSDQSDAVIFLKNKKNVKINEQEHSVFESFFISNDFTQKQSAKKAILSSVRRFDRLTPIVDESPQQIQENKYNIHNTGASLDFTYLTYGSHKEQELSANDLELLQEFSLLCKKIKYLCSIKNETGQTKIWIGQYVVSNDKKIILKFL